MIDFFFRSSSSRPKNKNTNTKCISRSLISFTLSFSMNEEKKKILHNKTLWFANVFPSLFLLKLQRSLSKRASNESKKTIAIIFSKQFVLNVELNRFNEKILKENWEICEIFRKKKNFQLNIKMQKIMKVKKL